MDLWLLWEIHLPLFDVNLLTEPNLNRLIRSYIVADVAPTNTFLTLSSATNTPPTTSQRTSATLINHPSPIFDHKSLIGMEIVVPGSKWGKCYSGRTYTAVINSCIDSKKFVGYKNWEARFDDCTAKFDIDDLRDYKVITEAQHALLKPTCMPITTPNNNT